MRLGAVLWVSVCWATQLPAQQPVALRKSVAVAGQLAVHAKASYTIALKQGQYLEATVEQKGADVTVRLFDPAGERLLLVDNPNGAWGPESVFFIASAPGVYRLGVEAYRGGAFEVKVAAIRKPSPADRKRAEALLADNEAFEQPAKAAMDSYARVAELYHGAGLARNEAYALYRVGAAAVMAGDHKRAAEALLQSIAMQTQLGNRRDLDAAFNKLASVYYDSQDYQKAIDTYTLALAIEKEDHDPDQQAATLDLIGLAYRNLKEYRKAVAAYEEELGLLREVKNRAGEGEALYWLGDTRLDLEEYRAGIADLEPAFVIQKETQHVRGAAYTQTELGRAHAALGEHDQARACYETALGLRRELKDRGGEAGSLRLIASEYIAEQNWDEAKRYLELAIAIRRETKDARSEAGADLLMATVLQQGSQPETALEYGRKALAVYHELHLGTFELLTRLRMGSIQLGTGNSADAIASLEPAIELARSLKDGQREGEALSGMGRAYFLLSNYQKALEIQEQALAIMRERHDEASEGITLLNVGSAYDRLDQREKARAAMEQALAILRRLHLRSGEGEALQGLGVVNFDDAHYPEAKALLEESVAIARETKNRRAEAEGLAELGETYQRMGDFAKAIQYDQDALAIYRDLKDARGQGMALSNIGYAYSSMGRFDEAISYYERDLPLERARGDRFSEAVTISNLGWAYSNLAQYHKALDLYEQSFTMQKEVKGFVDSATQNYAGITYTSLGQFQKALEYFERALVLDREAKNRQAEATTLGNMGTAYRRLGRLTDALRCDQQSLTIEREIGDRWSEGNSLGELGTVYYLLQQYDKALEYQQQSLRLERELKDRRDEGAVLGLMGYTYRELGEFDKALSVTQEALAIARETGSRDIAADGLAEISVTWQRMHQPRVAIFYGKQAVNELQGIRTEIRSLTKETQRAYANSASYAYRNLADLLIAEGRLSEGEQVINLLKDDEYLSFVRRDKADASTLDGRADMTADESEWAVRYREVSDKLTALGARYQELLAVREPSPQQNAEMDSLQKDLSAGNRAFQQFLESLNGHFTAKPAPGTKDLADLRDAEALQEMLGKVGHGAVAIYTLAGDEKFRTILVTSSVQRAYEYSISAAELNHKIQAFRQAVQDPRQDPRPLGKELYGILVTPALAADLRQAKAETLMWSLDGALRYLPIAALYDGQHYLVEKYRLAVFTPASQTRLDTALPRQAWKLLGFGVTEAHEGFAALPNVSGELSGIVRNRDDEELLDAKFTGQALTAELRRGFPLVHIASHFNFQPGNEEQSFLLLGDGSHLSLADVKSAPKMFTGVDLLTLSACNTGVGDGGGDGREVEGFGVIAQRKGAGAVIAALWPVADESTSLLMREFYRILETTPGMLKAEALRQAQLALLTGKVKPGGASADARGVAVKGAGAPAAANFSHPYYWAPFFLMGNWQ
jgi:CHAT domain-containing protein/tetratricopeptide (TPR) repeat protein